MGIIAFFSRPEALERTSNTSLTQVSQQRVTEEPPARPGPRAFSFLQPSASATCTLATLTPTPLEDTARSKATKGSYWEDMSNAGGPAPPKTTH